MLPITLGGIGVQVARVSSRWDPEADGLVISLATSALYLVISLAGIRFCPPSLGTAETRRTLKKSGTRVFNQFAVFNRFSRNDVL
jgi:hypothetical protein